MTLNVTVLGSGVMGHGIAQISALAGHRVVLRDIEQKFLDRAMSKIEWSLGKMSEKGKITREQTDEIVSRIRPVLDLKEAVGSADLVVEAVPEVMNLKRNVYAELDAVAPDSAVLASNTSTLPITEIAESLSRPDRFIGIHFFNPPQLMKLVEVIPGKKTSRTIVDFTLNYVRSMGKEPVLCQRDVPGFIVNRLFIPMVHEACHLVDEAGYQLTEVDSAVKFTLGFPMGIFELADFTGMDVIHKATLEMHSRDAGSVNPHPKVQHLFDEKKLGQKSGQGFYHYSDEKYERVLLSKEMARRVDPVRIVAGLVNSAAWLVTNGVSDIEEIERAAQLGLGLKKPILKMAMEISMDRVVGELERLSSEHDGFYSPDPLLKSMH